jgi:hypothetical protein
MTTERSPADLYDVIRQEFLDNAPATWAGGVITYRAVGKVYQGEAEARDEQQRFVGGRPTRAMMRAFEDLRRFMARPGTGVWLTAQGSITPDGRLDLDFDHDSEPAWDPPVSVGHYLEEWEEFPRDRAHTPEWLRQRLDEARATYSS